MRPPASPEHKPRPTARDLLARARARHGERAGAVPRISGIEPSRAVWGEAIVVSGDFAPLAPVRAALRIGSRVLELAVDESEKGRLRVKLPDAPPGISDAVVAELFVVVARESSRPCRLALFHGLVLRRITRSGEDEWLLRGAGFGDRADDVRVLTTARRQVEVLSVSDGEIRVRATLAMRSTVRVAVGDRMSNPLQVLE
jgi:hypothetical protein